MSDGLPRTRRDLALAVWWAYLHTPYRWGGDDPLDGVDCSGLVIEGLKSVGLFPAHGDATAHDLLYRHFGDRQRFPLLLTRQLQRGCLVFWYGPTGNVRHVEIVWDVFDKDVITLGASGGGSRTTDRAAAVTQNAYVKCRLATGWAAALDPFG